MKLLNWFVANPKTSSLGFGALIASGACYAGWLDHTQCQLAILALLAALGILSKDA